MDHDMDDTPAPPPGLPVTSRSLSPPRSNVSAHHYYAPRVGARRGDVPQRLLFFASVLNERRRAMASHISKVADSADADIVDAIFSMFFIDAFEDDTPLVFRYLPDAAAGYCCRDV